MKTRTMELASSQRTVMKQSIRVYLYTDNMVIEGRRLGVAGT